MLTMGIENSTPYGAISITNEAIVAVASKAATECYGVVGLAPRYDSSRSRDEKDEGIYCWKNKHKQYEIGIYVYVAYGVKITEVANEVQRKVRYVLTKTFSIPTPKVHVYVKDIKDIESL